LCGTTTKNACRRSLKYCCQQACMRLFSNCFETYLLAANAGPRHLFTVPYLRPLELNGTDDLPQLMTFARIMIMSSNRPVYLVLSHGSYYFYKFFLECASLYAGAPNSEDKRGAFLELGAAHSDWRLSIIWYSRASIDFAQVQILHLRNRCKIITPRKSIEAMSPQLIDMAVLAISVLSAAVLHKK
jgi:hypothetical protein